MSIDTRHDEVADADRVAEFEEAAAVLCAKQLQSQGARDRLAKLKREAKEARELSDGADFELRLAAQRFRLLREGLDPDPLKHPLFDKPADDAEGDDDA